MKKYNIVLQCNRVLPRRKDLGDVCVCTKKYYEEFVSILYEDNGTY